MEFSKWETSPSFTVLLIKHNECTLNSLLLGLYFNYIIYTLIGEERQLDEENATSTKAHFYVYCKDCPKTLQTGKAMKSSPPLDHFVVQISGDYIALPIWTVIPPFLTFPVFFYTHQNNEF